MRMRDSIRSAIFRSTYQAIGTMIVGLGVTLAAVCFSSVAVVSTGATKQTAKHVVNCTNKGARLPLVQAPPPDAANLSRMDLRRGAVGPSELPQGCEGLVSPLTRSALARAARLCLS
jgi:hypothetical protein